MLILQIPYSTYLRHSCFDVKREISKKGILLTFHVRNEFPTSVHPKNSLSFFHCKKKETQSNFLIKLALRRVLNRCYQRTLVFRIRFTTSSTASAHISTY